MKISSVDATVLRDRVLGYEEYEEDETVLISVTTDDGVTGYGEALARSAAVKAVVESEATDNGWDAGIRTLLLGEDPTDAAALCARLKERTFWSCRSGIGHVAIAGVETALWDLAGKLRGAPVWQLMGERRNPRLVPYATLYHGSGSFADTLARTLAALEVVVERGYRAAKLEAMPNNAPTAADTIELVARARDRVTADFALLLDAGYRWRDFDDAAPVVRELDQFQLFALEAPFPPERVDDYRRLAGSMATPVATGDALTAAVDYAQLLDSGAVRYLQAGAARTGVGDMAALARSAAARGVGFIPWNWVPTALASWANLHMAVGHDNVPLIEYRAPELYPEARLRSALAGPEPVLRDGEFELPTRAGLGVDVDVDLVRRLEVAG
jgi:L-alanine-DL-glutamate epimerase-like enolase superfamily enzyme